MTDVVGGITGSAYHKFRDGILSEYRAKREKQRCWGEEDNCRYGTFYEMRKQIGFFREQVRDRLQAILEMEPELEPVVRRALGIPVAIPLFANQWPWWRCCVQWFVPYQPVWRYIRTQLNQVKTYEGRGYLYTHIYARLLVYQQLEYFSPQIDFILRRLPVPSRDVLLELQSFDPEWVQAAYAVGLRNLADIEPYARYGGRRTAGWFAHLMVMEGIVQTKGELEWLQYDKERLYSRSREDSEQQRHIVREIVRVMSRFGIERQSITAIYHHTYWDSDPAQLSENLALLTAAGVPNLTRVLALVGKELWRTAPALWHLLVNVVGAKTPDDIQQFKRLLDAERAPPEMLVRHLQSLGARLGELVMCQTLLLSLAHRKVHDPVPVITAVDLLAAPPHSLSIEQLAACIDYVVTPEPLAEFLTVLGQHGYGSASDVLAFQVCYRKVSATYLHEWLSVVGSRGRKVSTELVADWVRQAQQGGYVEAYRYLLSAIPMPDFSSLKQAQPLVVFGSSILRYLVEDKSLNSLAALRDWYFHKAKGVHGLSWWGREDDELFRLLLNDAFQRQNYVFVMHNRSCVDDVLSERMTLLCGARPYRGAPADIAKYNEAIKGQRPLALSQLMPVLPRVLQDTGGILLQSVLRCAWDAPEMLQARLGALSPMIDELLAGRGPGEAELEELAVDAIAMVYQTSSEVVRRSWPNALGQEADLGRLMLESSYPMTWQHAIRSLQSSLERSSLLAMVRAKSHAEKFDSYRFDNISNACRNMRSKRLTQDARDPWSLAAHLGVLFAAAGDDDEIQQWRAQGLEQVAQMAEEGAQAFEYMEQLDKLFSSSLPDALDKNSGRFLARFSAGDAEFFAERLVGKAALAAVSGASSAQRLQEAFSQVRENVLEVCRRWVSREKAKFQIGRGSLSVTALRAVLSKHPAAYFAKHAANLCSKDRHEMWHEQRHAHLVVFDHKQRRLAGMALVNIEIVPALHPERECLVIRAINPMDEMLATHTVASIVEAFLDVAVRIAEANDLAAVAMPWHNGAHLLSNLRPVEKYLEKQYINKAERAYSSSGLINHAETREGRWRVKPRAVNGQFYAYQSGQELVSTLYAIWCGREDQIVEKEKRGQVERLT